MVWGVVYGWNILGIGRFVPEYRRMNQLFGRSLERKLEIIRKKVGISGKNWK
jgi:hypothetical protein